MSQVELYSNPSVDVSVHRWSTGALGQLHRKNKMTSLPFWIPSQSSRNHQFRLVLLRGIVTRDHPEDDPIGLVLELIPPPIGVDAIFPGGCAVTARVINRVHTDRSHDIVQNDTIDFSPMQLQLSFHELIPAAILKNHEFAEGDGPSMLLEVTIQTGVNPTVERVTQTLSSVWIKLYSSFNEFVQKASKAVSETREEHGTVERTEKPLLPWEDVPSNWLEREDEWRRLTTETLVLDEGTFRYGPNRGFSKDEEALLLQCGLRQRLITNAHSLFNYDRDVHEGLLTIPALRQQRYNLVPGKIKEEVFWANYFWKVSALRFCNNSDQVKLILTVLNAPPAARPRDFSSVRLVDEETVLAHVSDAQEAADMLIEYMTDETPDGEMLVEAAAAACVGHTKQLDAYFKRSDLSDQTLKFIGAVLKRLRERLAAYERRNENCTSNANDMDALAGASWTSSMDEKQTKPTNTGSKRGTPDPQASTSSLPLAAAAAVADETLTTAAPREQGASPDVVTSTAETAPADLKDQAAVEDTASAVSAKPAPISSETTSAVAKAAMDFPRMPWEEEDADVE
ncbi:BSD domain [Trypanosoma vivax]|nr:BSD domain [Trypanosoma vivax]